MPYCSAARLEVVNESGDFIMFYYKIDFLKVAFHIDDILCFHSYRHRHIKTQLGEDFEILSKVEERADIMI